MSEEKIAELKNQIKILECKLRIARNYKQSIEHFLRLQLHEIKPWLNSRDF